MFEALAVPKAAADGSKPQAFHVVAPSLPGYGFSSAPRQPGFGVQKIAQTFDALMSALGYQTYVAQGAQNAPLDSPRSALAHLHPFRKALAENGKSCIGMFARPKSCALSPPL